MAAKESPVTGTLQASMQNAASLPLIDIGIDAIESDTNKVRVLYMKRFRMSYTVDHQVLKFYLTRDPDAKTGFKYGLKHITALHDPKLRSEDAKRNFNFLPTLASC